ncbi:hypothetical protein Tco_1493888 [Tanacetum coccineum]
MSMKPVHNMSSDAEKTQPEVFPNILDNAKLHTSSEPTQPRTELYLAELIDDASGIIIVMICHIWDVHTITGHYVSADFIMSDANVCSVYCIKNFVVQANKEEYRIFKDHAYMIEFDGATSVRKTSVKGALLLTLDSVDKLYLSSGSSTHILDDPQIPALRALRAENRLLYMSTTLRLRKARWKTYSSRLRTERMFLRPSNAESRLMTSGQGWDSHPVVVTNVRNVLYGRREVFGVRLELDVSHKTASTVVVMFDEPATELVKCSTDSLAKADKDVGLAYANDSFTCWRIAPEEVVEEDASSSNVGASAEVNTKELKRLATKPSVATSSKPVEEQGKKVDLEESDEEVTCGMDDGQADATDSSVLNKRKKKRYIVDDSASE